MTNALYYRVSSSGIHNNIEIIKNNNNIYTFITHNEKELFDCNIIDSRKGEYVNGYHTYIFTLKNIKDSTNIEKSTTKGDIYIKSSY